MRSGNLLERVVFYSKTTTRDEYNASVDSWSSPTITTRGEVRYIGGAKTLSSDEKFYSKAIELTVRYRPEIVETMKVRINDSSYFYDIDYIEILGRKEGLRILLEKSALTYAESIEPSPSPSGTLEDYISDMIFWGDTFDFTSNTWTDKSGNNNNIILKNASARTGNGANLDYTITGLLTTDTVEVIDGSDTPTIPTNGTLRIGATQTVYGVTIKRSGEVWAIIPFCEPKLETNLPTRSFDVSGNGHHAVCATLAEGNITVQHNYFYLLQNGYNLGSENVIGWDVTSWTGSVDDYTAIFSGVSLGDAQSADRYLQPTPDGLGCRYTRAANSNFRLRRYTAMTTGKTYRFKIRIENFESNGLWGGLQISNLDINVTNNNRIVGNGSFDYVKTATNTTLELGSSNPSVSDTFDFYDPELRLYEIVPSNIAGTIDALGRELEYTQDGKTLLKYAADIELPEALISADQKGCWSDYINQGYCVSGKTYLIEQTQLNHFGVGFKQYDEFVSNGTEYCDDNNVVRELILNDEQRGFFFDDDGTPHPRGYTDLKPINTHYYYCNKSKTEEYHVYNPFTPTLYPQYLHNALGYGWKAYKDNNVISDLVIFKDDVYIEDDHKIVINSLFDKYEYLNSALFSIVFDSMEADELDSIVNSYNDRRIKLTRAIVFSDLITKSDNDTMLLNNGHEIIAHTPGIGEELTERKGFHDTSENYTNEELDTYYNAVVDYMTNNNYVSDHKIYPGGAYDLITQGSAPKYFKTAWRAAGSDHINQLPLATPCNLGRYANDFTNATDLTNAKNTIDRAIATKGWTVFYTHNYSWSASSLDNMCELLDYVATKIQSGEAIRFAKIDDAYNIIKKIK